MASAVICCTIFALFLLSVPAEHHSQDHEETVSKVLPVLGTLLDDHYRNDSADAVDDRNVSKRSIDYQFVRSQSSLSSMGWGICDSYLAYGEGNLTSHNYPFNYPDGVNCRYNIPRVDWASCALELTFHDFDVRGDASGFCQDGDYLLLSGRRFCGRFAPGHREIVHLPLKEKQIDVTFHSDGYESARGFWIEVRWLRGTCPQERSVSLSAYSRRVSEEPACDFCVRHTEGRVTSYGYPGDYKSNLNCTYRIERQPGYCAIELDFVDFLLEESDRCTKDFVVFDGIRYCGNTLLECRNILDFHGKSELVIPLVTDAYGNFRGFDIRFRQIMCSSAPVASWTVARRVPEQSPYCDEDFSSYQFYLRTPGHPSFYDNDLDCKYSVSRASVDVCELQLTFLRFDLEQDRLCRGDFLDVSGEKLCGHLPAATVRRLRFYGSRVQLHFHSDDTVTRPGFEILVKQKVDCSSSTDARILPYNAGRSSAYCDAVYSNLEFYIQSMNFPREYGNLADCAYVVRKYSPSVCELQLTFLSFQLEDDPECRFDYLEIDGRKTCAAVNHGTVRRIPFDKPELVLRFHSDRSTTRPGFQIFAQQRRDCHSGYTVPVVAPPLKPVCDHVYTSHEFSLRSPNFPSTYSVNCQCIYRLLRASEEVCELELRFHELDIEDDAGCRYDYLDLDGQKLCGSLPSGVVRTLKFNRPEMVFTFHADHSIVRQGFDITVRQKTDCDERKEVMILPPKPAPPPITIYKAPVVPIAIVEPKVITVPITYMQLPSLPTSSCDQVFTTWEFYMQSVHFPLNYGNNVACTYRAARYSLSVCAWELHFMSFDVEHSSGCQKDFLEANGERFCGPIAPGTVRRYLFDGPEFVLRFRSDSQNSGLGFYVLVRQITQCAANYAAAPLVSVRGSLESYDAELQRHGGYVKGTMRGPVPQAVLPPGVPPPPLPPSPRCDFSMTQPSSQFTSGHYPSTYNQGLSCTYRIARAKDTCAVEIYFYDFDVESSPDCGKDYLEVGGKKFCGSELIGQTRLVHFDNKDEVSFRFVTDGSGSSRGWWVYYRQVSCAEVNPATEVAVEGLCDNSFCDELGFIRSHSYPLSSYAADEDCFYRIKKYRPEICTVQLSFTDFDLEDSAECTRDYLEINRVRYCGNQLRGKSVYVQFPPGSDQITMWFKSDSDKQGNGFFIQARQLAYACDKRSQSLADESLMPRNVATGCHQISDGESGTFISPEYPILYSANRDCTYTVKRNNAAVCGLELKFIDFSLETSRLCTYDYFQVPPGDRLCGNSWTGISRSIPFPSSDSSLEFFFRSDSRVQDRGFAIGWKQLVVCVVPLLLAAEVPALLSVQSS